MVFFSCISNGVLSLSSNNLWKEARVLMWWPRTCQALCRVSPEIRSWLMLTSKPGQGWDYFSTLQIRTAGQRSCELPQVTKLGSRRATFDLRSSGSKSTCSSLHHTAPGGFTCCFTAKDPPVSGFLISKSHEKIRLTVGRWFTLKMVWSIWLIWSQTLLFK